MNIQIVMDLTGDTRHYFDATDDAAVTEAKKRFQKLTDGGYTAAKKTGTGTSDLIREFDPTARETLFMPRLVGG